MKGGSIINRKRLCYIFGSIILASILLLVLTRIPFGDKKELINKLKKNAIENEDLICNISKTILSNYSDLSDVDMKDWEKLILAKDKVDSKDFEYLLKNADVQFSFMDTINRGGVYFEFYYYISNYNNRVRGGIAYIPYSGIEKIVYFMKNIDKKYYKISSELYAYQYNATRYKNKKIVKKLYNQYKDEFSFFSKEANEAVLKYIILHDSVDKYGEIEPVAYETAIMEFLNSDSIHSIKERRLIIDELRFEYVKQNNPYLKNLISFIYRGSGVVRYGICFDFEGRKLKKFRQECYGRSVDAEYHFQAINQDVYTYYTEFYGE